LEAYINDEYEGPKPTPQLIASLRQSQADVKAGKGRTMAQVEESLAAKEAAWLQPNPR
jgi:hypothetical protein